MENNSDNNSDKQTVSFSALDTLVGYKIRRAQLNYFNHFQATFAEDGVSPGQFGVLSIVAENPGLTQTAVAQALGNDRSAMVAVVDRFEKDGLIERRPVENDRRSYALYLTDAGTDYYASLYGKAREHEARFDAIMTPEEKGWLLEILQRLADVS